MKIKISDITEAGFKIDKIERNNYVLSYFKEGDEIKKYLKDHVYVNLTFEKIGENIMLDGKVTTILTPQCARCLEEFPYNLNQKFYLALLPQSTEKNIYTSKQNKTNHININNIDANLDLYYYKNDEVDTLDIIGEQISLGVPMLFLCKEDCKGLCQYCWINKNIEKCSCEDKFKSPKFEKLKTLKLKRS